MSVPAWLADRVGTFTGTSNLYFFPPTLEGASDSVARLAVRARGAAVELAYSWSHNGSPAEGLITFHIEDDVVKASFTDSWHLSNDLMSCIGEHTEDGGITVFGTYPAPPGPDWGWRITLTPTDDFGLHLQMFNVEPGAEGTLAVDCQYGRIARPLGTMNLGAHSVSLAVADLGASRAFYETLGFESVMGNPEFNWLILRNGACTIGLFQGMFEGNILTFNPGWAPDTATLPEFTDIRELQTQLLAAGITFTMQAEADGTGPGSATLVDPDGNAILIDQHVPKPA